MKKLYKRIGAFSRKSDLTIDEIIQKKEHYLMAYSLEDYIKQVEFGMIPIEDMLLALYDYKDGGVGSVFVCLVAQEVDGNIEIEYVPGTEYLGNVEFYYPVQIGDEETLLDELKTLLLEETKEFAKYESSLNK